MTAQAKVAAAGFYVLQAWFTQISQLYLTFVAFIRVEIRLVLSYAPPLLPLFSPLRSEAYSGVGFLPHSKLQDHVICNA